MQSPSERNRYISRAAERRLAELAGGLRIVMVNGPRQSGKSTLLTHYLDRVGGSYRTLDTVDMLAAARDDPVAFARYGAPPRGIDEVQLGGDELIRAIKVVVDADPQPGAFILSGSSRFLTIPTLSESLAGRLAFVELWPLSMAERVGSQQAIVERLFGDPAGLLGASTWHRDAYLECVVAGGYPEALRIPSGIAQRAWFDGYLATVINRDIRDFASITRADAVAKLLSLVAARSGSLAVLSDLAEGVELARDTARNYLSYLDIVFLTLRVPAWSSNRVSRLVKTPKLYVSDSGLAAHLLGADADAIAEPGNALLGPLLETFVIGELTKALAATDIRAVLYHVRTTDRREVDFLLEGPRGRIVAIEIKASTSPGADAFRGLRWISAQLGANLHAGILFHLGTHSASRGDRLYAMPLSTLWEHRPLPK